MNPPTPQQGLALEGASCLVVPHGQPLCQRQAAVAPMACGCLSPNLGS